LTMMSHSLASRLRRVDYSWHMRVAKCTDPPDQDHFREYFWSPYGVDVISRRYDEDARVVRINRCLAIRVHD
jgi:hypothetical protein